MVCLALFLWLSRNTSSLVLLADYVDASVDELCDSCVAKEKVMNTYVDTHVRIRQINLVSKSGNNFYYVRITDNQVHTPVTLAELF